MLKIKEEHPSFERIDYWWLDDLIEQIEFGKHSHTASEIKKMADRDPAADDRTISIRWKCGFNSTLSSGVKFDFQDPGRRAAIWDSYITSHPDRYPHLAKEMQKMK